MTGRRACADVGHIRDRAAGPAMGAASGGVCPRSPHHHPVHHQPPPCGWGQFPSYGPWQNPNLESDGKERVERFAAATSDGRDGLGTIGVPSREIAAHETPFAQGLTRQTQRLTPQRELARLHGIEGQIDAATAEAAAKIAEIEIEILRLGSESRGAAIVELRDLEFREIELRERRKTLREELGRLDLRAPASGVIYGSTVDTVRAVLRPAEPVTTSSKQHDAEPIKRDAL